MSLIKQSFGSVTALMPVPYFYSMAMKLPIVNTNFRFLNFTVETMRYPAKNVKLLPARYFTLPLEAVRKKSFDAQTKSCIKAIAKNGVNPDLIHANFLEYGYLGAGLKNQCNVPLIVTANGGDVYNLPFKDDWYYAFVKYVLDKSDQVITVSQFLADKLLALGVEPNKLHMIPNGFNNQMFKPTSCQAARHKLGLPLNKKILLSVGNLNNLKGHTYLIEAMKQVIEKQNDVLLIIVGAGPLELELQKQIVANGLQKNVFLVGNKRHEEIPIWMNACDLFVHPSLHESFGVVIIEAMACGKPVLGTSVGGVPEIIRNKEVGLLVKSADAESLSQGMLQGLSKKWAKEKIIDYSQQYAWDRITNRILGVYEKALESKNE